MRKAGERREQVFAGAATMEIKQYDYIVVGSGFGGSVSAMRLAQKGYDVAVLEAGKRYRSGDFATSKWQSRKLYWLPKLSLHGIYRIRRLKHVHFVGGAGVGGGSLNYANTMYVPPDSFFQNAAIRQMGGKSSLLRYYQLAGKMLGVTENPVETEIDSKFQETIAEFGRAHTYSKTPLAVYFGEKGITKPDPYFLGEGPDRTGCELCGGCMTGCNRNAKNSLDKNYLYFAEKFGATIIPECKVTDVIPLSEDGANGYEIRTESSTGRRGEPRKVFRTKGVVFSAGVLGTLSLLLKMKEKKLLPRLSAALGQKVRTNSEVMLVVRSKDKNVDFTKGAAITSSVYPDEVTHIQPVRFSEGINLVKMYTNLLVPGGKGMPRQLRFILSVFRHPVQFLRWLNPLRFDRQTIILLVMQALDSCITISRKAGAPSTADGKLNSTQTDGGKIPTSIPIAEEFARRLGERVNGYAGNLLIDLAFDVPTSAHVLGGCSLGSDNRDAVIDLNNRVFGYESMLVCDGSMLPANLGVNPALTITALSERAMSFIPPKKNGELKILKAEKAWGVAEFLTQNVQA